MTSNTLLILLISTLSLLGIALALLVATCWRRVCIPAMKWLGALLLLALVMQLAGQWYSARNGNNLFLLHIYTLLEFGILSLFYHSILRLPEGLRRYWWPFVGLAGVLIILNTVYLQPWTGFNNNAKTLTQFIYIAYAITWFFQEISLTERNVQQRFLATTNSAVLLYYAGSLFIFMFSSLLAREEVHYLFWIINGLLYILFLILVIIAIWIYRRQMTFT